MLVDELAKAFDKRVLLPEEGIELCKIYRSSSEKEKEDIADTLNLLITFFLKTAKEMQVRIPAFWFILGVAYALGNPEETSENLKIRLENDRDGFFWAALISFLSQGFVVLESLGIELPQKLLKDTNEIKTCMQ